jgi:hypothetical protein
MGTHDDFFEALGPTSPAPNDTPGFFTKGTQIWRGVDVTGRQLGVRGRGSDTGSVGVIGLSAAAVGPSSGPAGVVGVGDGEQADGVRGEALGPNAGVHGIATSPNGVAGWGVKGECKDGTGVSAFGDTGIYAEGITGVGLRAKSGNRAQINLMPNTSETAPSDPKQFPVSEVGDLAVTITDALNFPSLWFCVVGGPAGQSVWKKIA